MENIYEHNSYRDLLRCELTSRIQKNPNYSMRSFAKQLEIPASLLSAVLNSKRNLSLNNAKNVATHLGLEEKEKQYLYALVQYENARSVKMREEWKTILSELNPSRREIQDLQVDSFRAISDWYHMAIMQCFDLKGFDGTVRSAATKLGISLHLVREACERLSRLELLEPVDEKRYRRIEANPSFTSERPNESFQKYHRQILEKAIDSLKEQTPYQERLTSSEIFAFNRKRLIEAEGILEECLDRIVDLAHRDDDAEEIYQLGIQLFRISKKSKSTLNRKVETK